MSHDRRMKVLVCIDLSPLSKAIADEAGKIAKATGATLELVHVVRAGTGWVSGGAGPSR